MSIRSWAGVCILLVAGVACVPAAQPQASGGQESGQPKAGGVLNVTVEADPFDWDITYVGKSNPNVDGIGLSYLSLLKFKSGPEVEYAENQLQPELAEKWSMSPDGRSFTFNLRQGVKYPSEIGRASCRERVYVLV